ncbi:MAG: chemotaxis protein CheA [Ignavibacteriales bacterium]|nr:MAG: chemotaxis protein CheA [Ignavibacteriales bacterium]
MLTDPEMKEIVDSFIVETTEILENLNSDLVVLEKKPKDAELLNKIFRSFHTIKGTSGFLGLEQTTKVTHKCEDILNKLRKGEADLTTEIMDGILLSYDKIKSLLAAIANDKNENVEVEETIEILTSLISEMETGTQPAKKKSRKKQTKKTEVKTPEPVVEVTAGKVEEKPLVKEKESPVKVEKTADKISTAKIEDTSIRVDVERLDELLNIVSELVLGRNRLAQVNSEAALEYEGTKLSRDLSEAVKQIDLMTNELQLVVMKTRMVKIGKVFNRYPRIVRDLSKETNKNVNLVIRGEETELDKTLIEEINDPLVHLIRNSVDHGIEKPDVRKKKGKDAAGTITLSAEHEGNNIIITIEDDGKGIDPEMLKEKAVAKGLITKERAKELSRQEALNLIMLPGFSTAEVVTNVSGRGVGMDVVKTNVTKLRGLINIESTVDKGTKIIIKLPLTLAIIPGMIVGIKSEKVVIPLSTVIEVVRVHQENIYTINQREVIKMRDSILPLVDMTPVLAPHYNGELTSIWQYVVVVGIAEKRFGIKVDEMVGQKEVVIKSLGSYLGSIHGIAGSTIMGDGTVVMILDIGELLNDVTQ